MRNYRLVIIEDGASGQLKLKLIQGDKAIDIKVFTRADLGTTAKVFGLIADVFTELREKFSIDIDEADKLFKDCVSCLQKEAERS